MCFHTENQSTWNSNLSLKFKIHKNGKYIQPLSTTTHQVSMPLCGNSCWPRVIYCYHTLTSGDDQHVACLTPVCRQSEILGKIHFIQSAHMNLHFPCVIYSISINVLEFNFTHTFRVWHALLKCKNESKKSVQPTCVQWQTQLNEGCPTNW